MEEIASPKKKNSVDISLNMTGVNLNLTQDASEQTLSGFLFDTIEINDLVITDKNGEMVFFHSQQQTLDEAFIRKYKSEFKFLFNSLYNTEATIEEFSSKYKNINDYFYKNGIKLFNRLFNITRFALPFVFTRDLVNNEEMCVIKTRDALDKYIIIITYFPDYTSPLIIGYLKEFLQLYNSAYKIDDDFNRY